MARDAGADPSLIVSSPYLRAVQTAEIAAKELGWKGDILQLPSLVPHGTPEGVWSDLRDHREESSILLAGHEPLMAHLAAFLLSAPGLTIDVKKSAMIHIEMAVGAMPRGVLRWMIVPKLV
jgi:phosphohistidine phosphatase